MKKVLFFTAEPGGAAVLAPLVGWLQAQPAIDVTVLARGHGATRLAALGIAAADAGDDAALANAIAVRRPGFVVTSATSLPRLESGEHAVWQACAERGVPCLAMLDQWQNYRLRFARPEDGEPATLPRWINCINDIGRQEMLAEGFPAAALVALGHPALAAAQPVTAADRRTARDLLGLPPDDTVFLFVSEPIALAYGRRRGYTQFDALRALIGMTARAAPHARIHVKLHPKDDRADFGRFAGASALSFAATADAADTLIAAADRVYGMTSVMLVEAFLRGVPAASIQPGLVGVDPLVLTRYGFIECATDPAGPLPGGEPRRPREEFDCTFDAAQFLAFVRRVAGE